MSFLKSKPGQWVVLGLVVLTLGWLFLRAAGPAPTSAAGPLGPPSQFVTVSGSQSPTQRHTAPIAKVPISGLPWIAESALPREARQTLDLIRAGGPYPYPRSDNQTFSNRERILPKRAGGYYREYTVLTPGASDRGARRIISGRDGDRFYTADHYGSFSQIREGS